MGSSPTGVGVRGGGVGVGVTGTGVGSLGAGGVTGAIWGGVTGSVGSAGAGAGGESLPPPHAVRAVAEINPSNRIRIAVILFCRYICIYMYLQSTIKVNVE
jgi:hypothetical protein